MACKSNSHAQQTQLDDLPESPVEQGLTAKEIMKFSTEAGELMKRLLGRIIFLSCLLYLWANYILERENYNDADAYHCNIDEQIQERKDPFCLVHWALYALVSSFQKFENALTSVFSISPPWSNLSIVMKPISL